MSIQFNAVRPIFCPECPPTYRHPKNKEPVREGARLALVVENYSGCGVDICQCEVCGKRFEIQYNVTVSRMIPLKS